MVERDGEAEQRKAERVVRRSDGKAERGGKAERDGKAERW